MPTGNPYKAFFAHASEDNVAVEAVYQRVLAAAPDLAPWLDKYEILAGESLIERIAGGMDDSDKFVIFLSPVSITKPWVNRELRRAIMREIQGIDPDFIIPVLAGEITKVPAFLEDKKYIALYQMSEEDWLPELIAAVRGIRPTAAPGAMTENVAARVEQVPGQPHIARVVFEARLWSAKVEFGVMTSRDIVQARFEFPGEKGGLVMQNLAEHSEKRSFALNMQQPQIRPGYPVAFVLEFSPDVDALTAIEGINHWDPW